MPLIRICDHFHNNPKRIDKLICIKGLPDEWLYRDTPEGRELKKPWQPDIEANIPHDIRHLCEPMYINFRYSPITQGQKETIDRRQVLGLKIDYNTEPGREMWEQVERYLEESIPRDVRVPVPVLCAKDERAGFETYTPKRNSRNSLELHPSPVPEIDLTKYVQVKAEPISPPVELTSPSPAQQEPSPQVVTFVCVECDREFKSQLALNIHKARPKNHAKVKEKAGTA
jgi:hypothetical protein